MLRKENRYFEDLRKSLSQYHEKYTELQKKRHHAVEEFGWESKEVKAISEEFAAMRSPVSSGACKAHQVWSRSVENGMDEVEMFDSLWENEVADFVQSLKNAGIQSFVYTAQSTAVMENLHELVDAGCKMEGLCTITKTEWAFGKDEEEQIPGVRFSIQ